jgi:hypothetical protein
MLRTALCLLLTGRFFATFTVATALAATAAFATVATLVAVAACALRFFLMRNERLLTPQYSGSLTSFPPRPSMTPL